jgi:predicted MFS family arabinose efflux permease
VSADAHTAPRTGGAVQLAAPRGRTLRTRAWGIVAALSVTETVSWGILYYAFAVFLIPMQRELGFSTTELTGAFSVALLVSGIAGIAVGRHLDRHSPRTLMTLGSIAAAALVLAWSQVDGLAAFYAVWIALGLVMAAVLYEPAFTVLAKHFHDAGERRRAMTAMTLVAALASFIFMPLAQALIEAHGWRDALIVLAVVLAAVTVPLHAVVLRPAPAPRQLRIGAPAAAPRSIAARDALRTAPFWLLSAAFVLASITSVAVVVHAVPFLIERGHSPAFAAFAVGLIGISQLPGRVPFAPLAARLPRPAAMASVFVLVAVGVALIVSVRATGAVIVGLVVLGMGNGMGTLARATAIADLYGAGSYGTIAAVTASMTTAARAAAPVAAALDAALIGYSGLLWTLAALAATAALLAWRAEQTATTTI